MPPRTRSAGPPEGGYKHFEEPKREKKPKPKAKPKPKPKPKVTSPIAAPSLTMPQPVQTPRKRPHEGNSTEKPERALKRVNTEPRPRPTSTFLFDPNRGRSHLTPGRTTASISKNRRLALSQSARKPIHTENPFDIRASELQAAFPKPHEHEKVEAVSPPIVETPTKQPGFVGRIFGSIKKTIFGGSVAGSARGSESPTPQVNPFEAAPIAPRRAAQASRLTRLANQTPKTNSYGVSVSNMQPTVEDSVDSPVQAEHNLDTTEVPGSRKRKLDMATEDRPTKKPMLNADENGNVTGSWGLTDEDLEYSDDDEPIPKPAQHENLPQADKAELPAQSAEATEPERIEELKTPGTLGLDNFEPSFSKRGKMLRSAMKSKPNTTGKKVGFKSDLTSERTFYRDLGPAGHYTGTLFAFGNPRTPEDNRNAFGNTSPMSLDTQSTTTPADIDKGRTISNTHRNRLENQIEVAGAMGSSGPWWEKTPTDQSNPNTPVITNPSGHFSVPDFDDSPTQDEPEEPEEPEEPATAPSAPKIPHASLPATDERLNKARQEAQQYKPKQSSRLSNVEPARSRSTSPTPTAATNVLDDEAEKMREAEEWAAGLDWPKAQPCTDPEAAEKMHEAENWAANLDWPKPQSYVDAGLCSPYIDQLLRDRWTKEDDRLVHEFWTKEFREVNSMMDAAKAAGKTLELVYEED